MFVDAPIEKKENKATHKIKHTKPDKMSNQHNGNETLLGSKKVPSTNTYTCTRTSPQVLPPPTHMRSLSIFDSVARGRAVGVGVGVGVGASVALSVSAPLSLSTL